MDAEKRQEIEKIIDEIYQLQLKRKLVLEADTIVFRNKQDKMMGHYNGHIIYIKNNLIGKSYKDSILHEFDMAIELLVDKLRNT